MKFFKELYIILPIISKLENQYFRLKIKSWSNSRQRFYMNMRKGVNALESIYY